MNLLIVSCGVIPECSQLAFQCVWRVCEAYWSLSRWTSSHMTGPDCLLRVRSHREFMVWLTRGRADESCVGLKKKTKQRHQFALLQGLWSCTSCMMDVLRCGGVVACTHHLWSQWVERMQCHVWWNPSGCFFVCLFVFASVLFSFRFRCPQKKN